MRLALGLLTLGLAALPVLAHSEILPNGDCAGVYWDLTAVFDSGDRIYARVLVTRAGPGDRNAASLGHWFEPDGTRTPFQNGRGEGRFEFSPTGQPVRPSLGSASLRAEDRLHLRIGSTRLDLGDAVHHFAVDNDKRGVKLLVSVEVPTGSEPAPIFAGDLEVELVALGGRTTARVWRTGMDTPRSLRGWTTLVRTRHAACEHSLAVRRVDVHRLGPEGPWLLIHQQLANGVEQSWLGWRAAGGVLRSLRPDEVAFEDWRANAAGSPLPQRLRPKSHELRGSIGIGAVHLSIDPLDALPRLVRMLYWFGASPRRIWADATSELTSSAPETLPRGAVIASFTFLHPPDDPTRSSFRDPGGSDVALADRRSEQPPRRAPRAGRVGRIRGAAAASRRRSRRDRER